LDSIGSIYARRPAGGVQLQRQDSPAMDTTSGALHETVGVNGVATNLEFLQDGLRLRTSLGFIEFQTRCGKHASKSPLVSLEISTQQGEWIALNGERVLWLLFESRPSCLAVKDSALALGHTSGRVVFMEFRL
jgi:hypothetical protein